LPRPGSPDGRVRSSSRLEEKSARHADTSQSCNESCIDGIPFPSSPRDLETRAISISNRRVGNDLAPLFPISELCISINRQYGRSTMTRVRENRNVNGGRSNEISASVAARR